MEHDTKLEDVGWKVLQRRQVHLERLVRQALRTAHDDRGTVDLLDLAVGSGRQILEILRSLPDLPVDAVLLDADPGHLEAVRELASRLGVTRVRVVAGDAMDRRALARLDPKPDVVVAAGLFELIPDDDKVANALAGLAAGMRPGGHLVYTDQPFHPHLEMIGRVAVPRDESPWAMRRRTPEELDAIFAGQGFTPEERLVDEHGLFTVGRCRSPLAAPTAPTTPTTPTTPPGARG